MRQKHQLAQVNIAKMNAKDINDPIMADFVANIERLNELAEKDENFIWRFKGDVDFSLPKHSMDVNSLLVTISVWKSVEGLKKYVHQSMHAEIMKRRKEWFKHIAGFHYALWWIPTGQYPSPTNSKRKIIQLQENGPSKEVFTFKESFHIPKTSLR